MVDSLATPRQEVLAPGLGFTIVRPVASKQLERKTVSSSLIFPGLGRVGIESIDFFTMFRYYCFLRCLLLRCFTMFYNAI